MHLYTHALEHFIVLLMRKARDCESQYIYFYF